MTIGEVNKTIIAVAGAVASAVPQILSTFGDLIPQNVATWLSVASGIATFVLVYLVPNVRPDRPVVEALPADLPSVEEVRVAVEPAIRQVDELFTHARDRAGEFAREAEERLRNLGR